MEESQALKTVTKKKSYSEHNTITVPNGKRLCKVVKFRTVYQYIHTVT